MKKSTIVIIVIIVVAYIFLNLLFEVGVLSAEKIINDLTTRKTFNLLSNPDNSSIDDELMEFAKKNKIKLNIIHADDLEAIDMIEANKEEYDA